MTHVQIRVVVWSMVGAALVLSALIATATWLPPVAAGVLGGMVAGVTLPLAHWAWSERRPLFAT